MSFSPINNQKKNYGTMFAGGEKALRKVTGIADTNSKEIGVPVVSQEFGDSVSIGGDLAGGAAAPVGF